MNIQRNTQSNKWKFHRRIHLRSCRHIRYWWSCNHCWWWSIELWYFACFEPDEYSIHICLETDNLFNILFALAHEFRHIWQYEEDEDKYIKNQKSKLELVSKAYNLQIAEVDANAFAHLIMTNFIGVKPSFETLDEEVKNAIYKRERQIAKNLNMKVFK